MPYCPACRYEYRPGIALCPDCGVGLVDRLPDPPDPSTPEPVLVALRALPGRVYADMLKEVLEARGIPCLIQSSPMPPGYAPRGTRAAWAVVLVPANREQECAALQAEMFGPPEIPADGMRE